MTAAILFCLALLGACLAFSAVRSQLLTHSLRLSFCFVIFAATWQLFSGTYWSDSKSVDVFSVGMFLFPLALSYFILVLLQERPLRRASHWLLLGNNLITTLLLCAESTRSHLSLLCYLGVSLFVNVIWLAHEIYRAQERCTDPVRRFAAMRILRISLVNILASALLVLALPIFDVGSASLFAAELWTAATVVTTAHTIRHAPFQYLTAFAHQLLAADTSPEKMLRMIELVESTKHLVRGLPTVPKKDLGTQTVELFSENASDFSVDPITGMPPGWLEGIHFSVSKLQLENRSLWSSLRHLPPSVEAPSSTPSENRFLLRSEELQEQFQSAARLLVARRALLVLGEKGVGKKSFVKALFQKHFGGKLSRFSCEKETEAQDLIAFVEQAQSWEESAGGMFFTHIERLPIDALQTLASLCDSRKTTLPIIMSADPSFFRESVSLDQKAFLSLFPLAVELSPLRTRPEDLKAQLEYYGKLDFPSLSPLAQERMFKDYSWPGNSAELVDCLANSLSGNLFEDLRTAEKQELTSTYREEREALLYFLRLCEFDQVKVAALLGVSVSKVERISRQLELTRETRLLHA